MFYFYIYMYQHISTIHPSLFQEVLTDISYGSDLFLGAEGIEVMEEKSCQHLGAMFLEQSLLTGITISRPFWRQKSELLL